MRTYVFLHTWLQRVGWFQFKFQTYTGIEQRIMFRAESRSQEHMITHLHINVHNVRYRVDV